MRYLFILLSIFIFVLYGCTASKLTTAKLYINKKDYNRARPILKEVILENDKNGNEGYYNNAEVYYILGYLEGELENYSDMKFDFDKSLSISPKYEKNIKDAKKYYWMLFYNKGVNSYNSKDYQRALRYFESALEMNPNDPETEKNLTSVNAAINGKEIPILNNTKNQDQAEPKENTSDAIIIASFNGNGIKNTRPFKTDGPWEIHWKASGSIFQVYLHSLNGDLVEVLASQSESGDGSSYCPKRGEFYLNVNTNDNWTIHISNAK